MRLSEKTVRRAILDLCKAKILETEQRYRTKGGNCILLVTSGSGHCDQSSELYIGRISHQRNVKIFIQEYIIRNVNTREWIQKLDVKQIKRHIKQNF